MKKLIFVMFSMCIAACAEHDEMGSTLIVNRAQKNRSMSEAIQLANDAARLFPNAQTRLMGKCVDLNNIICVTQPFTRNRSDGIIIGGGMENVMDSF